MKSFVAFTLLLSVIQSANGAALRTKSVVEARSLQVDGIKDFAPLSCNANIGAATCKSWTSTFGTSTLYTQRVEIPCGECITMDLPGGSLTLQQGIDIVGKLVFPDGYSLNLSASIIAVQGELEMTASKTVNGIPNIKISMIGNNDKIFTPIDVNTRACNGAVTCNVGKKAFIVAGGKVNIKGLPNDTPAWTRLNDVVGVSNNPSTILVPSSVFGKWGVGAEILITPHTRVWNQNQVRTVTAISLSGSNAAIALDSPILRPTTIRESPDYAVEVALLSRNIVFEGGSDSNALHGGHFMVMNTPSVVQAIVGVDLQNFGQQGNLGRYPIHFHFCNDVAGSIVAKNTIRQSNQRCVVVHGTNKLRIEENVAFDTKGHCYLTEDGMEMNNEFIRNLGAQTGKVTTLIPDNGSNGEESDHEPATFWITAPSNFFDGNVAAGSEHSGYWFEPKLRGPRASMYPGLDPQYSPLGSFVNNVAHSNSAGRLGAIRMYVPGYFPSSMTSFTGLKVYRNDAVGIFIHRCHNLRVDEGLFADNNMGIDLDRAEGVEVTNTEIIGMSPSYQALLARQPGLEAVCDRNERVGIDLHTWQKEIDFIGAKISNVKMSGFGTDPRCVRPSSIRFDRFVSLKCLLITNFDPPIDPITHTDYADTDSISQNLKQGLFEFYTAFEGIELADGLNSVNMCVVNEVEYDLVYIIDLDGSFRPNRSITPSVSSLVASDNDMHMTFLDPSRCVDNTVGCYSYCHNTCFRSMRYYVEGPGQESYMLKVCSRSDYSKCSLFKGGRRGDTGAHEFTAHVPDGQLYDAVFLNGQGQEIMPQDVTEVVEKTFCSGTGFDFKLLGGFVRSSPIASPRNAPVRPPVPAPVPVRAPARSAPIPVPTPIRPPVPVPVKTPVRPPAPVPVQRSAPVPVKAPAPIPVRTPVRTPVAAPVPVRTPVRTPVAAPVKKKSLFEILFPFLF